MGAALTKPFAEIKKAMMDALKDTANAYVKFATIYVEAIDEDAKNADKIKQAFKTKIAPDKWAQIEAVGRKWMHPAIALGEAGVNAGAIRRLPYSLQERVMKGERFPMLTSGGELPLMVDIKEIEGKQAKQMLNREHIRSISEQRAYLDSLVKEKLNPVEIMPYRIVGRCIEFNRGTKLTRAEMKRILQEM